MLMLCVEKLAHFDNDRLKVDFKSENLQVHH